MVLVQTNGAVRPIIRKKAALCLLRLLRKAGPDSDMLAPDAWSVKLVRPLYLFVLLFSLGFCLKYTTVIRALVSPP